MSNEELNTHPTTENKKHLTRREYLSGGAALAASVLLPGCGGGDDEDMAAEDNFVRAANAAYSEVSRESAQAARFTPVVSLSSSLREVYFIEVSFRGSRGGRVLLQVGSDSYVIGSRALNTGSVHALQFATLDTTPSNKSNTSAVRQGLLNDLMLYVEISQSSTSSVIHRVGKGFTSLDSAQRTIHQDTQETEWLFAWNGTASSTNWDVAVRFFYADSGEMGNRRADWVTEIARNLPTHQHNNGRTIEHVSVINGTPILDVNETSRFLRHDDGLDTLVLPSHRHRGHFEMLRPLLHITDIHAGAAHIYRRIKRHIQRFSFIIHNSSYSEPQKMNLLFTEACKVLYGGSLAETIYNIGVDSIQKIKALSDHPIDDGIESLCNYAEQLDLTGDAAKRRLAVANAPRPQNLGPTTGIGIAFSSSLQAKVGWEFSLEWLKLPFKAHIGCRVSLLAARYTAMSLKNQNNIDNIAATYSVRNRETDGIKLGVVGIVGPSSLFSNLTGTVSDDSKNNRFSFDLEVTTNMTIKKVNGNRKCRVDSVTFDPVIDFNMRDMFEDIVQRGFGRYAQIITNADNGTAAAADGTPGTPRPSSWFENVGPMLRLSLASFPVPIALAGRFAQSTVAALANGRRVWSLAEFSTLRFNFINGDSFPTYTGNFRPGFQGPFSLSWTPAAKFFLGYGSAGKVKWPGTENTFDAFIRVFNGIDTYLVVGTKSVQNATLSGLIGDS